MNHIFGILAFWLLGLAGLFAQQQECTLGVGGKDTEVIVQVFQLNPEQRALLEDWSGEFQEFRKAHKDSVQVLFDTHPQDNPTQLLKMSEKFRKLKEELVAVSRQYDQKLLAVFNEKQYQRYAQLCTEVDRRPMERSE